MKRGFRSHGLEKGFSLLEILVAIAVLAILVALFFQVFTGTQSALSINTSRIDALKRSQFFFGRLETDFQNRTRRADLPEGIAGFGVVKQTGNDSLRIVSRVEGYNGTRRLAVLQYRTAPASEGLQRGAYGANWTGTRPAPFLPQPAPTPADPAEYELLDAGIFRCEFQYIDASGAYQDAFPPDAVALVVTVVIAENPELNRIRDRLGDLSAKFRDSNGQRLLPLWKSDLQTALSTNPFQDIPRRALRIYENVILL